MLSDGKLHSEMILAGLTNTTMGLLGDEFNTRNTLMIQIIKAHRRQTGWTTRDDWWALHDCFCRSRKVEHVSMIWSPDSQDAGTRPAECSGVVVECG